MRTPTNADLRRFVETEGWVDRDATRGAKTGDHHRYVFHLKDGAILYTRISHGSGAIDSHDLFKHILRTQLKVTAEQFWACVDHGVLPPRPQPSPAPPKDAVDAKLLMSLVRKAGVPEAEVRAMTRDEALARWHEYLSQLGGEGGS